MSIFIPVPNNKMRVKCTICQNEVSKSLQDRHQQFHVLGDMALSKTETSCKLCLTPISIKADNYVSHLMKFHKLTKPVASKMNKDAKEEAKNRDNELPKPTFQLPKAVQNQVIEKAEQVQKKLAEQVQKKLEEQKTNNFGLLPRGRPRTIPNIEGETDIERERRINRETVNRFRNKIREQRGLPPPKQYNRTLVEGESQEEREKRLNRERVRKFREAKKAQKAQQQQ